MPSAASKLSGQASAHAGSHIHPIPADRGRVLLLASRYGSGVYADVLQFADYLGVRLRAVATVRCWDEPWLSELVRRCRAAGLVVTPAVAEGAEQGSAPLSP